MSPVDRDKITASTADSAPARAPRPALERGACIDRYIVVDQLGSGGMGVVYKAFDPELGRPIALKLLNTDQDAAGTQRDRLLREAQALAQLSHPNVIAVHDVGTFGGDVFIAMEFVEGLTLRKWLAKSARSQGELLAVFAAAGEGLQAAHRAGLVHRDFKPDNVIVGDDGRVRVLDFGLARSARVELLPAVGSAPHEPAEVGAETLDDRPPDSPHRPRERATASASMASAAALAPADSGRLLLSPLTHVGSVMGTPPYMAPEQHLGQQADERADQFSFCVTLYEALYGERPFAGDTMGALSREVVRGLVREPPKGSRVPRRLREVLLRGLRPLPEERYPSMEALLGALARDPAVERRRALGVLGALALVAALGVSYRALSGQKALMCRGAADKLAGVWDPALKDKMRGAFLATGRPYAKDAFDGAARALDAYTSAWVAMHTEACEATRVRGEQSSELLDLRMECLSRRLDETRALTEVLSRGDAKVVENAVTAVNSLGELTACADASALKLPAKLPSDPARRARIADLYKQVAVGKALDEAGRYAEALPIAKAATVAAKDLYRPLEAETWNLLGDLSNDTDDYKTAETAFREATLAGEAGGDDDATAHGFVQLFEVIGYRLDRFAEAHEIQRYAEVAVQRAGDERHRARLLDILAGELAEEGRYDDALAKGEDALKMKQRLFGPDHPETAKTVRRIGVILYEQGRYREALELHRRALASDERVLGARHPVVATALEDVGDDLRELGRYDEALIAHRRALEVRERAFGSVNARAAHSLFEIGVTLATQGNLKEALGYYQRAQETQEKSRVPDDELCDTIRFEAQAHAELGQYAEAERLFARTMSIWTRVYGADHPYVAWVLDGQSDVRAEQGRYDEALTLSRRALAIQETAKVTSSPEYADTLASIGAALRGQGRLSEALGFDRRALGVREKAVGGQNASVARDRCAVGDDLRLLGQLEEARGEHQRAIAILEQVMGPGHPRLAAPLTGLGEDELELRGFDRAAAALERALALRLASPGKPIDLAETRFALARALRSLGRDPERARKLAVEARATWLRAGARCRRELVTVDAWLKG